jgi:hypothetical protein
MEEARYCQGLLFIEMVKTKKFAMDRIDLVLDENKSSMKHTYIEKFVDAKIAEDYLANMELPYFLQITQRQYWFAMKEFRCKAKKPISQLRTLCWITQYTADIRN